MTISVKMPALSPTMSHGRLLKWLVKEGDTIEPGQAIFEIETDKAVMEVESVDEGVLGKILIPDQTDQVPVNEAVAILLEDGEDKASLEEALGALAAQSPLKKEAEVLASGPSPSHMEEAPMSSPEFIKALEDAPDPSPQKRLRISPLAKRIAKNAGLVLDVDQWLHKGSGPRGRIIAKDVEDFLKASSGGQTKPYSGQQSVTSGEKEDGRLDPVQGVRKIIAERLTQSKQEVPHFYLTVEANVGALLEARRQLNQEKVPYGSLERPKISVTHFVLQACALGLQEVPEANRLWDSKGGGIRSFKGSHVAVAVAREQGLVTPVLAHLEHNRLYQTAYAMNQLVDKSRSGTLSLEEMTGGVMTISNLGMYGIDNFSAILNPPHSSILALGKVTEKPYVSGEGEVKVGQFMAMTLSVDHRVLDGDVAAKFLKVIQFFLENPQALLAS